MFAELLDEKNELRNGIGIEGWRAAGALSSTLGFLVGNRMCMEVRPFGNKMIEDDLYHGEDLLAISDYEYSAVLKSCVATQGEVHSRIFESIMTACASSPPQNVGHTAADYQIGTARVKQRKAWKQSAVRIRSVSGSA